MSESWIKFRSNPPQTRLRLFCFPHSGGSAQTFRKWSDRLPAGTEVCPVEYPGHATRRREPPAKRMDAMVDAALNALVPELNVPFAFFGHSLGALVAFELTRALADRQQALPEMLFLSSRRAPHLPLPHEPIHTLADEPFVARINELYGGIPAAVLNEPELLQMMLPVVRADMELYETYEYNDGGPVDVPLACFRGDQDPSLTSGDMAAWEQHTSKAFSVKHFSGDHFYITSAKQDDLLAAISTHLMEIL